MLNVGVAMRKTIVAKNESGQGSLKVIIVTGQLGNRRVGEVESKNALIVLGQITALQNRVAIA